MVHVTIVGFLRSSCRTIAVRHDVCGAWLWKKSNKSVPLHSSTITNWPNQTNQLTNKNQQEPWTNQKNPPLKFQRYFFWLKPPNFSVANQHQPTNSTGYKSLEGMVHCRNLAVSTWAWADDVSQDGFEGWQVVVVMVGDGKLRGHRKRKICNANSQKFLRDHVLLNCFFLRWNWEDTFCLRCDFFRA